MTSHRLIAGVVARGAVACPAGVSRRTTVARVRAARRLPVTRLTVAEAFGVTEATYEELARAGRQIYVFYNNPLAVGLVIAAIYVIIN
jgi:hypothetical protein